MLIYQLTIVYQRRNLASLSWIIPATISHRSKIYLRRWFSCTFSNFLPIYIIIHITLIRHVIGFVTKITLIDSSVSTASLVLSRSISSSLTCIEENSTITSQIVLCPQFFNWILGTCKRINFIPPVFFNFGLYHWKIGTWRLLYLMAPSILDRMTFSNIFSYLFTSLHTVTYCIGWLL